MKIAVWFTLLIPMMAFADEPEFLRALPDSAFCAALKQEDFKNADGVIVLKETYYTKNKMRGAFSGGYMMSEVTILIAKLFNEAAVKRFGSYEYEHEIIDRLFGSTQRARVRKGDGTVFVVPQEDFATSVSVKTSRGEEVMKKTIVKIPNLQVGDVVQIETVVGRPFVWWGEGVVYHQDELPVLFSNLALTYQEDDEVEYHSAPAGAVGEPTIQQLSDRSGTGATRFWSVANLPGIQDEPYAPPFSETTAKTVFIVKSEHADKEARGWNGLGKRYWERYLDKGSVKKSRLRELDLPESGKPVTRLLIDSLYTALRRAIVLQEVNSLHPYVKALDDVFDEKKADASDMAAVFFKILKKWDVNAKGVWIRDRRSGPYLQEAPALFWFDRLGVVVTLGDSTVLYDFDRAIPNHFATPWFLKDIVVKQFDEDSCNSFTTARAMAGETWFNESHALTFSSPTVMTDTLVASALGGTADGWRSNGYERKGKELSQYLQEAVSSQSVEKDAETSFSDLFEDAKAWIKVVGRSKANVASVDSFVSVKPVNDFLTRLQGSFTATVRTRDVVFREPLCCTVSWTVHHPAGYKLVGVPAGHSVSRLPVGTGEVEWRREGDDARGSLKLELKQQRFSVREYPKLVQLLTSLQVAAQQEITFRKAAAK